MNALALMATLGLDSSGYEKGLDESKKSANSFAKSITKILGGIAIGVAVKKTVDGIVSITKAAVNAYGEFEQLAGGIETLFGNGGKSFDEYAKTASDSMYKMGQRGEDVLKLQKELIAAGYDLGEAGADGIYGPKTKAALDAYAHAGGQMVRDAYENTEKAQQIVMENADKAFMTAGLSANDYMATVTSFSASLIQSLGGDTEKAAHLSDQAILDMADNANKMGSDMGSIQAAYAGFAKQNYTMLDNLKLGYGGTKTEMERLIKDANDLRKAQGLNADLTIESYADVIEAIHTVQENMGITGTTAKEAEHTIQGSLSSTKAAWQNLLTSLGSGKDVKKAIGNLTKSAKNVVKNVVPVVKNALTGIGEMVRELGPVIIEELPGIVEDLLPTLLSAIGALIRSVARALPGLLGALWNGLVTALSTIWNSLVEQYPILGEIADKIGGFFTSAWETVKEAWNAASTFFSDIWTAISTNETLIKLGDDISGIFTKAWEAIQAVWDFVSTYFSGLWGLITGEKSLSEVGESLKKPFTDAWDKINEVWNGIVTFFADLWKGLEEDETFGGIATTLSGLFTSAWATWTAVWNGIKTFFVDLFNIFTGDKDITSVTNNIGKLFTDAWDNFTNVWDGLVSYYTELWKLLTDNEIVKSIGNTISGFFIDAWNDVVKVWDGVVGWFEEKWNAITKGIATLADDLAKPFKDAWATVEEVWNTVVQFFSDIWSDITGNATLEDLFSALSAPFVDAWNTVKGAWDGAAEWLGGIWEEIKGFIADPMDAINELIQLGVDWVQGFWDKCIELKDAIGGVLASVAHTVEKWWNAIIAPIQRAVNAVRTFLGLNSQAGGYDTTPYSQSYGETRNTSPDAWKYEAFDAQFDEAAYREQERSGKYWASAMGEGRILRGLTPFGVDRSGTVHYGGEAGAEAVVGVGSLRGMIQQSVNNALGGLRLQVVLDSGVLVGEIAPQMDTALNDIADWKGGGRAG